MYRRIDNRNNWLNSNIFPHVLTIWRTSAHYRLRSVSEFEAPQQISTGFASWLRYFRDLVNSIQQKPPRTFGWAAITLGIGPHSSF